ncbi:MAG: transposase [Planctomycetales bacterium]
MSYWAIAPVPRHQIVLINTTLDDLIPDDHMVRVIAEVLEGYDWAPWEAQYHGIIGQPPIHPRTLAGVWLYGLRQNVRSSRKMEYMTRNNVDFMWLASGHTPDHSAFSNFRKKFGEQLNYRRDLTNDSNFLRVCERTACRRFIVGG